MKIYLKRVPGLRKAVRLLRGQPIYMPRERVLKEMAKRSVCAEIGVHEGEYAQRILGTVKPIRLHLIDPWEHEEGETYRHARYGGEASEGQATMDSRFRSVRKRFAKEIGTGRVVLHRGYSADLASEFRDEYFDWVYIDANHLREYVKLDLELYYPKVKRDGYLTGDDYGVQGWWDNGVQKAVDEFVGERSQVSLKVIGSQFIIRKGGQEDG